MVRSMGQACCRTSWGLGRSVLWSSRAAPIRRLILVIKLHGVAWVVYVRVLHIASGFDVMFVLHMMISLAFIAPDIIEAVAAGRLPRGVGVTRLMELPTSWLSRKKP